MATLTQKKLYADLKTTVKALGDGEFEGIVATNSVDRQGETLDLNGLDTTAYMQSNPVVLYGHDYSSLPIGKALSLTKTADGKLVSKFQLAVAENPVAATVAKLIKGGFLNTLSIGFVPHEVKGDTYTKSEMVEYSVVPVPANAQAVMTARSLGLEAEFKSLVAKSAINSDLPINEDLGTAWDSGEAIKNVKEWATDADGNLDFAKYSKAFMWVDPANADKQGGYKLPFANVSGGELKAIWRGVAGCASVMNGGRGGVMLPEADRLGVIAEIKKYYTKFGKEAPEMKSLVAKGPLADELAADAAEEQKWDNVALVQQLFMALYEVYCDPATPVDSLNGLLTELQGLIQQVIDGTFPGQDQEDPAEEYGDEGDGEAEEMGLLATRLEQTRKLAGMLKQFDTAKQLPDNIGITGFVAKLKELTGVLEETTSHLSPSADTHATVRKRKVKLVAAKKTAKAADRLVEGVLSELNKLIKE